MKRWAAEDVARCTRLWLEGTLSSDAIGAMIGRSGFAVSRKMREQGVTRPTRFNCWTPEQLERASRLWLAGSISSDAVGRLVGRTGKAVASKMNEIGVFRRAPGVTKKAWSQAEIDWALKHWDDYSASQIGAHLGRTRSAVLGKLDRLGALRRHKSYLVRRPSVVPAVRRPATEEAEEPAAVIVLDAHPVVRSRSCQWPIGDPGQPAFHFCGGKPVTGRPYCDPHCRIAYKPAPKKAGRAA